MKERNKLADLFTSIYSLWRNSAGKSSTLEVVTGFPFPRQDGLYTALMINVSLIPHSSRSQERKDQISSFNRALNSFSDLPDVIAAAGAVLGLSRISDHDAGPTFAQDVLQIRVNGPTGLHLSAVDLQGIIQVRSEEQADSDIAAVHSLVDSYMANGRSIILAVVYLSRKKNANQPVMSKCKKFDPSGERTIGVITKPDLINDGAKACIAQLSRNEDTTKLGLGFFLLKNPSPKETQQALSLAIREAIERDFSTAEPWSRQDLNPSRLGINHLRRFLQELLDKHIERELPKENYSDFGFLGTSSDSVPLTRLRAIVHASNTIYSEMMRSKGEQRKVVSSMEAVENEDAYTDSDVDDVSGQLLVSEREMKAWVKKVYLSTRGRQLPGDFNHVFLAELFHLQSSRWLELTRGHLSSLHESIETFMDIVISHIAEESHTRSSLRPTYNHYYTDNIQRARNDAARKALKRAMDQTTAEDYGGRMHISNSNKELQRLLASLQSRMVVNMDDQACNEARDALEAYYKVARKRFFDNVCRQVVERHLIRNLCYAFSPEKLAGYTDDDLYAIAGEFNECVEKRERLKQLSAALKEVLAELVPTLKSLDRDWIREMTYGLTAWSTTTLCENRVLPMN
ncbi:hypothetical protein M409DRAFT_71369 [Zasmidium cellare ATCC 36951]|uniref:GED domain-containing protein n=1 Tax=Zasmidium cellare ATCC 36951 TaxID=1080233 RepID=A0A6A6BZT3_ZASCE|nr:uncharacterized protein M409DRAFT_71369 [Zasmidium cellare ATCC 36951]KAF2158956.1 hypothetical protein M409DRAFT_71369 [Zasmidium cellare ATCC 36951]